MLPLTIRAGRPSLFCLSRSHYIDTDPTNREWAATAGIEPMTSSPGVARSNESANAALLPHQSQPLHCSIHVHRWHFAQLNPWPMLKTTFITNSQTIFPELPPHHEVHKQTVIDTTFNSGCDKSSCKHAPNRPVSLQQRVVHIGYTDTSTATSMTTTKKKTVYM